MHDEIPIKVSFSSFASSARYFILILLDYSFKNGYKRKFERCPPGLTQDRTFTNQIIIPRILSLTETPLDYFITQNSWMSGSVLRSLHKSQEVQIRDLIKYIRVPVSRAFFRRRGENPFLSNAPVALPKYTAIYR